VSTTAIDTIDNTPKDPRYRPPLVLGENDFASVTDMVCRVVERPRAPLGWYIGFAIALTWLGVLVAMIAYLFWEGVGVWGLHIPVGWGWAITNFVFWVGIGHAGTLISAILYLFHQKWRTSINRLAEAMTIFAVICAGMFPAIHVGRVWVVYWLFPYPNQMQVWPNFRSPLLWDMFAVGTYFTVSLMFWYVGMIPDLATLRDRATTRVRQVVYGIAALGWRGSHRHWHRHEVAYLILAGLATPLVLSVHSVVSFDFSVGQLPGWHSTIFPPYFVAGAIFSGCAVVILLIVPARQWFGLKDLVTLHHLENINKLTLATGSVVGYAYLVEVFIGWYSGNMYEWFTVVNRVMGPYAWAYWIMVFCNAVAPQLFWFKRCRTSIPVMLLVAALVNLGMWTERFVIIVSSLANDFLPSSWGYYRPTWVDVCTFIGSIGLFFTLFMLFCRWIPIVAMAEVRTVMPQAHQYRAGRGEFRAEAQRSRRGGSE
jgi:Ni/Fe-hydrogenase subunit HybB-like protein